MPVRSSTSSILRWPDARRVRGALEAWAREEWRVLLERRDRFARMLVDETVWLLDPDG